MSLLQILLPAAHAPVGGRLLRPLDGDKVADDRQQKLRDRAMDFYYANREAINAAKRARRAARRKERALIDAEKKRRIAAKGA